MFLESYPASPPILFNVARDALCEFFSLIGERARLERRTLGSFGMADLGRRAGMAGPDQTSRWILGSVSSSY